MNQVFQPLHLHGFGIPKDALQAVLDLPRDVAMEELLLVLADASLQEIGVDRTGADLPEDGFAVVHSLNLLAHLKAAGALPQVASFLQLSPERLRFCLGRYIENGLWEVLWHLFRYDWQALLPVLQQKEGMDAVKLAVLYALGQIALLLPGFRVGIFEALEEWMQGHLAGQYPVSDALAEVWVRTVVDLRAAHLLPVIESLYAQRNFVKGVAGTLAAARKNLVGPARNHARQPDRNLFERYAQYLKQASLASTQPSHAASTLDLLKPPQPGKGQIRSIAPKKKPLRKAKRQGRNDPCSCGSGKKYKRCCGAH